jgi:phytoene dehydrogenase-like protein
MTAKRSYDAIVIGGGHNGLVNGAYLAKSGLRTLIIERRHIVGGAAITEELIPGFHFTTFSYALSLLRPDIIHELELTKHGFMPIQMPSAFAPMENGDYLLMGTDRNENLKEIARHSKHDADAMDQYEFDMAQVCQALKPLVDSAPPNLFGNDPADAMQLADLARRMKSLPPRVLQNCIRLLTGSSADFLDDYFESDIIKGWLSSSSIIGSKVGPRSQGSGLVLLFHNLGEHDGHFGSWAFHKGGNGGFTQVVARAAQAFGAEIVVDTPVDHVMTNHGKATGVALAVASASKAPPPRSTSPWTARHAIRRSEIARISSAASPTSGPRWTTSSVRSTTRSTAGTASGRTSMRACSRWWIPTWHRPASTSCRASSSTRRTS